MQKNLVNGAFRYGALPFRDPAATNTAETALNEEGFLCSFEVSNIDSLDYYIHWYDAHPGDVTVGTTAPKLSYLVPAGDGTLHGATSKEFVHPPRFETAISYAVTVGPDGDDTAPTTPCVLSAAVA